MTHMCASVVRFLAASLFALVVFAQPASADTTLDINMMGMQAAQNIQNLWLSYEASQVQNNMAKGGSGISLQVTGVTVSNLTSFGAGGNWPNGGVTVGVVVYFNATTFSLLNPLNQGNTVMTSKAFTTTVDQPVETPAFVFTNANAGILKASLLSALKSLMVPMVP
jgi:hypothetical protein